MDGCAKAKVLRQWLAAKECARCKLSGQAVEVADLALGKPPSWLCCDAPVPQLLGANQCVCSNRMLCSKEVGHRWLADRLPMAQQWAGGRRAALGRPTTRPWDIRQLFAQFSHGVTLESSGDWFGTCGLGCISTGKKSDFRSVHETYRASIFWVECQVQFLVPLGAFLSGSLIFSSLFLILLLLADAQVVMGMLMVLCSIACGLLQVAGMCRHSHKLLWLAYVAVHGTG